MEAFKDEMQPKCRDCGAELGEPHKDGCDTARCSVCHGQRLVCNCENSEPDLWTGLMYPELYRIALDNDLWCRSFKITDGRSEAILPGDMSDALREQMDGKCKIIWHIPCKRTDAGAQTDLNRAAVFQARN